jgi:hypothetical protein
MARQAADQISDIEVVAHLFALARTERYRQLKPMFEQALVDFPQLSRERMLDCCDQLARMMHKSDYDSQYSSPIGKLRSSQVQYLRELRQELLEPGL